MAHEAIREYEVLPPRKIPRKHVLHLGLNEVLQGTVEDLTAKLEETWKERGAEPTPPRLGEGLRTSPLLLSDVIAPCPGNFEAPNYLASRQMALVATTSYANPGGKPSPFLRVAYSTCAPCFFVVVRPFALLLVAAPVFDELISLTNAYCNMGRCCVPNCRGNYGNGPKVRLFSFPRDVKRRAEWQRAVRRRDVDVGLLKDPKCAPLVSDDVCIPGEIRDVRVLDNLLDDVERYIEKKAHQEEDKVGKMLGMAFSSLDDICDDELHDDQRADALTFLKEQCKLLTKKSRGLVLQ
ncbi:hypothetical protein HPB47_016870 [Ixodes persulcatus]|uniref:Uncharacterized protein n=1 Tax=Ixodes persulcatus TaxID=34615 RepID=A0AC60QPS9_IXOPE|nr:hypothetical protein HPB47_016870 [Ixodes persulcatus]